ncbi:MAG: oxygenase MpaB family protein [Verrucomicrobiota bacterium]
MESAGREAHEAQIPGSDDFVFPLDSEMWRINHQWIGLLYGPAAAILQIAHPMIGRGVADHSDFRADSLGRLTRTLRDVNSIAFGTYGEANEVRDRLRQVHRKVRGPTYNAFEPELMVWVLATLVYAAATAYERWIGPLTNERKQALLADFARFGNFFGLQEQFVPNSWSGFEQYYASMVHSGILGSDPISADLTRHLVHPRDSLLMRAFGAILDFLPVETLPPELLAPLGLRSTWRTRVSMAFFSQLIQRVFPLLPQRWRLYPESRLRLEREPDTR